MSRYENTDVLTQGKVKSIEGTSDPHKVICNFSDRVTAGNGKKEAELEGKGKVCTYISELLFSKLEEEDIRTHLIRRISDHELLCKAVNIVPIEVVVRNRVAGGIVRETCLMEGIKFPYPLV